MNVTIPQTLKEEIKKVTRATPTSQVATSPSSSRSASPITKVSSSQGTYGMREDISARTKLTNAENDDNQSGTKSPLNMEYLKHVVIGFMENKQARVCVLSFATIFYLYLTTQPHVKIDTANTSTFNAITT